MKRSRVSKDRRSARRELQSARQMPALSKWLEAPDAVARRGEVWNVAMTACRLYELDQVRSAWWWRLVPVAVQNRIIGRIVTRMTDPAA